MATKTDDRLIKPKEVLEYLPINQVELRMLDKGGYMPKKVRLIPDIKRSERYRLTDIKKLASKAEAIITKVLKREREYYSGLSFPVPHRYIPKTKHEILVGIGVKDHVPVHLNIGPVSGVYFLGVPGRTVQYNSKPYNVVKIGKSVSIKERIKGLDTMIPFNIKLLGFIDTASDLATHRLEKKLHNRFDKKRFKGEWFRYKKEESDKLYKLIQENRCDEVPA